MKKYITVFVAAFCACLAQGQTWTNGQAARAAIGQQQYTFAVSGTQQNLLGGASGIAYANGLLFVADSNVLDATPSNHRVLIFDTTQIPPPNADLTQYPSPSPFCGLCGYSAINVLGEPDYVTQGPQAVSSQSMNLPTAVATDGHVLVVADTNNNRVLIWNSIPLGINQPANVVLGNASFTTPGPPTATQTTFRGPQGVWVQNGKLFVADTQNYRILIWNSIPTQNNQPADLVLGQSNFTTGTQAACNPTNSTVVTTASELCDPVSVTSDGTHLFVSDFGFSRVLIWNSIPTSNNRPADVVIGQPDMVSAVSNNPAVCGGNSLCGASLNFPRFALSDGTRLFVADGGNDRVLVYNSIPTFNGAFADAVLGQPDFTSSVDTNQSSTITIASTSIDNTAAVDILPTPTSLAWDGTNLYVADPFSRRVVVFTPAPTSLPDNSILNWASEIIRQEGVVSLSLAAGGAITANDTATVTLGNASAGTTQNYTYTVKTNDNLDNIAVGLVNAINANGGDPNATAIFAGAGTATIYLSSKATNLAYDSISLAATTSNTANVVATASGAYLTAGTAATASPGMLVEINGTNLSDQPSGLPVVASLLEPLPKNLGGAQVFMDGFAAPLLSVSNTQIIAQIPFEYTNGNAAPGSISPNTQTDRNSVSVYVRTTHNDGSLTVTNASPVYVAPANPGLFGAPTSAGQPRPFPAAGAMHQPGNPNAVVSIDGSVTAGNTATITINGTNYTYTVTANDTLTTIEQTLINQINASDPNVTATAAASFNRIILTAKQSGAAGNGIPIAGSTSSSATITVTPFSNSTCCVVTPGSTITPNNPAAPGELITVTGTGLGLLNSVSAPTGQPFNGPTPNGVTNEVVATMSGTTAQVVNAGLPTGAIGTYQIQMVVPTSLSANAATQLYVAQNAFISNIVTIPIGAATTITPPSAPGNPMAASIDNPSPQSGAFTGVASFGGWALDQNANIASVNVYVDGTLYGTATYGGTRNDVCAIFSSSPNCPNVGWNYALDTTNLADGQHTFKIIANGTDGLHFALSAPFTSSNPNANNPTRLFIDQPAVNSQAFQGLVTFVGWAVNSNSRITSVSVSIDGTPIGNANYGVTARPDVCALYPGPSCPNVGWSILVNTNTVPNGTHTLTVTAVAANGQQASVTRALSVANWSTANPTIINIDSPSVQSGTFSGIALFGGWVVNNGTVINSVQVSVDGVPYGNASYGGVRNDVCAIYSGAPGCPNVGWSVSIDTTGLGDGAHTLAVSATTAAGQSSTLTRNFNVANLTGSNALKLSIDTPGRQSPALSGVAHIGGWALSTNARVSSVQIMVDGVPYSVNGVPTNTATYGGTRSDVCGVFSASPDCPNVGWDFMLDTTLFANGTHILEVTGTSATGQRGTASASFTVTNTPPINIYFDAPSPQNGPYQGLAFFEGWAVDTNAAVTQIAVSVDGVPAGNATQVSRPDVCIAYPTAQRCPNVGWTFNVDTTLMANGNHTLDLIAYAANGVHAASSSTFRVANWQNANPTTITIDNPSPNGGPYFGAQTFGGWALNQNAAIATVSVAIDGVPFPGAVYGVNRPDVCAALPGFAGCPNVGWHIGINTMLIPNGNHTLAVTATSVTGQSFTTTEPFAIAN